MTKQYNSFSRMSYGQVLKHSMSATPLQHRTVLFACLLSVLNTIAVECYFVLGQLQRSWNCNSEFLTTSYHNLFGMGNQHQYLKVASSRMHNSVRIRTTIEPD